MSGALVDFLTARLDEDEAAAVRAARPESWVKPQPSRPDWYVQFWADDLDRAAVIADPESSAYPVVATLGYDGNDETDENLAEGRVEHIARHDPARVLADIAAKRRILARHSTGVIHGYEDDAGERFVIDRFCERCHSRDCDLLDLASAYAGHPDYAELIRLLAPGGSL